MMLKLFVQAAEENADWRHLDKNIRDGVSPISVFGVSDSQKTHIATTLCDDRCVLFVALGALNAEKIKTDYEFYTGKKAIILPGKEQLLGAEFESDEIQIKRIEALDAILNGAQAVIAPIDALLFNLMPPSMLKKLKIEIKCGENYSIGELTQRLVQCGYTAVSELNGKGEFFAHGGLLDIFPRNADNPIRIDFFDTEVETIKAVDPVSQRSTETIDSVTILPVKETCGDEAVCARGAELLLDELTRYERTNKDAVAVSDAVTVFKPIAEKLKYGIYPHQSSFLIPYLYPEYTSIFDYLPENTLVVFDEIKILKEHSVNAEAEYAKMISDLMREGRAMLRHGNAFTGFDRFLREALKRQVLSIQSISGTIPDADAQAVFRFDGRAMQSFHGKPELLIDELKHFVKADYRTVVCCGTDARLERIEKELTEAGIPTVTLKRADTEIKQGQTALVRGSVTRGFEYPLLKLAVIAENDIFSVVKRTQKASTSRSAKKGIDLFVELKTGDAVVHEKYGIGIYCGIIQHESDGVKRDYISIKYRDDDMLYVQVDNMNCVQKYIAPDDASPKLSKIGSNEWNVTKQRVKKSIVDMTDKLIALYKTRENTKGIRFLPDTPWQKDFEDDFQYEETPDQLRSIKEIKEDMESDRAMDRLLCGDVGYGKTEVALRAVFKAVMSGKQAAILAPTTILAQQHYNTLKTRLVNFSAVRVEVLSRFKKMNEQKKILADLAEGKVDILVGTHRLLAKDVRFKDLGLLVVDEEQRFGVAHKEKIKQLKSNIDVLTLSATPIPRTLNMALSGIRDMSLLETPPEERYPVQTYVTEYSDAIVRDAVNRELQRGGQVYYLYNRVADIDLFADRLRKLVPEARICIGHGQMEENALEEVIMGFYNGEYDILLCTTIIENGVDIPGANTLIVHNSQCFGLAQLYQLRGRVGRSNRTAYAYFTVPPMRSIGEDAVKRLSAIEEFSQMGSGFKIAMRDLEIRGAGNLLGGEQHGHMAKIGYDLYCKMIKETVNESLGKTDEEKPKANIEIKLDGYIPEEYIPNESVRFATYRRISDICDYESMLDLKDELCDRYGELPKPAENLLLIAYIRTLAGSLGVSAIKEDGKNVVLVMPKPDVSAVSVAIDGLDCVLQAGKSFGVLIKPRGDKTEAILLFLQNLRAYYEK